MLPDNTVIKANADIAPEKTVKRGCFIAMIAAIKKVLSPISDTNITEKAATKAWMNPKFSVASAAVPCTFAF